ncbi:DUF6629 family protein [Streptomyces albipurpureus]|uniref:Integral membrane protein n=1 Tax=Streptomyces albipurpureus TaxID=2897419 RepID=A0ABT0UQI4_9ACTN|nr:DUF6629 family protein [Streptomyces sp. CWNU-1]MCM2390690.1 hypothetical protein [Streptomyces sp. CWNU-1]
MCWSATADLVAGAAVGATGVYCVSQVHTVRQLPLAALPLLLGAHQIVESLIWRHGGGTGWATLIWAVIALPLLAWWVPLGVLLVAPAAARKRLTIPLAAGLLTTAVLTYCLATRTVVAEIRGHQVGYLLDLPQPQLIIAGYLLATVGALLLSGDPTLRVLGALTGVGAAVCAVLWRTEFVSTWCALAAVVSMILVVWVRGQGPHSPDQPSTA